MSVLSLEQRVGKYKGEKSTFTRDFVHSTTGKLGELIPVMLEEVIPGDYYKIKMSHILNLLPLAGKIQSNVDAFVHAFYVPNRVLQENFRSTAMDDFEKIITGRTEQTIPQDNLKTQQINEESLGCYLGIPARNYTRDTLVSKHPRWCYMQIYNDYYRNKVIQAKLTDSDLSYVSRPLKRNWRRDYFTSATPSPQYGNASRVQLDIHYITGGTPTQSSATETVGSYALSSKVGTGGVMGTVVDSHNHNITIQNIDQTLSGIDVNDIRFAYAYQDWLVRMLQSGDDYSEHLSTIFGVDSSDKRLQRAEYLGGYHSPVIINDVIQSAPAVDSTDEIISPIGTQGANGYTYGNSDYIETFIEEHGYIMVIVSILPKTTYYGGLPKLFKRFGALDFFFPQFAYLPEQEIKRYELCMADDGGDEQTFGYIERYAEYKHRNDMFSGQMIKDFTHLHFGRMMLLPPSLNSTFLQCDPRQDPFAVQDSIHYFGQFGFDITATRLMPFNVDGLTL